MNRHVPTDDLTAGQYLADRIGKDGPVSLAEYMEVANARYYGRSDPLGSKGDFVTAPEISQLFGEMIGLWLTDIWVRTGRRTDMHYVELGPGRATLAMDALRVMRRFGLEPAVHFVETSAALREVQAARIPHVQFHDDISTLPECGPLFVVANEFFDALPVRQFVRTASGWREFLVTYEEGRFLKIAGEESADILIPANMAGAPEGSIYEMTPASGDILHDLGQRMKRQGGVMLIIDYGYAEPGHGDTFQAVLRHEFADPFEQPGTRDLTAHVNFAELAGLARLMGLNVAGPVNQGQWLQALGIGARARQLADGAAERADEIMAAMARLTDPLQMGTLFKAVAISAGDWPIDAGF